MSQASARLPLSLCLGWASGTLGVAVMFNAVNILLLRYLTDYLGIAAAAASALIASSKLYDAVLNPVMGVVSDRTHTRWGRRRPWLLAGSLLAALALPALFVLPAWVPADWMIVAVSIFVFLTVTVALSVLYVRPANIAAREQDSRIRLAPPEPG